MKLKYEIKCSIYRENWWDIRYETHLLEISIPKEISKKKKRTLVKLSTDITGQYTKSFKRVD